MKNGQLDIDAVTEALGLGFSLNDSSTSPSRSQSPTYAFNLSESLFRKPGGPLCSIPEETDADDSVVDENVRPLSSLIERWGRIHQKFSVETAGEVRESVSSSILEVDLSLLGIDVSAISGIGTPIGLSGSGNSFRDTTYTIEALEPDEDSSGWLEDSNTRYVLKVSEPDPGSVDELVLLVMRALVLLVKAPFPNPAKHIHAIPLWITTSFLSFIVACTTFLPICMRRLLVE